MFRKREPEKLSNLTYSDTTKELINGLPLENMLRVADSIPFLEHLRFREEHKTDLHLTVKGYGVWAMLKGNVWMAYHEESGGNIYLEWVSLVSKFRR